MKSDVLDQFDRHCGRARYDFHQRVIKSIYDYENKLDETLESTITGIEKALSKALNEKEKKEDDQNKAKEKLRKEEQKLEEVSKKLENVTKKLKEYAI